MLRLIGVFAVSALLAWPARAAVSPEVKELYDALGVSEIIDIMTVEGIDYGATIEDDLFPGRGGDSWAALVARIYDTGRMEAIVLDQFGVALEGVDVAPLIAFFSDDRGRRIIEAEVSARRAFMDEEVEAAAGAAVEALRNSDPDRFRLLSDFAEVNDLVESNVMGAMNSNYAFYLGLMEGNAFGGELTEADILSDVWAQEAEIRADTEEWVFSYIGLAYQALSDVEMKAYVDLSRTEEGRALNRALFSAFDLMYNRISRDLGYGAAAFMTGQDI